MSGGAAAFFLPLLFQLSGLWTLSGAWRCALAG